MDNQISYSLGHLSDEALVAQLAGITRSHRALTAELVAHLGEMDARKLYLSHATSSLFGYCVERLGFSEDEACRRVEVARLARRFSCIYGRIERGEVTLSVLGRLKPVLTEQNATELLDAVSRKTVREAERVIAAWFPKPDVPDSIRKLPEKKVVSPEPTQCPAPMPTLAPKLQLEPAPRPPDRGRLEPLSAERIQVKFTASKQLEDKLTLARELMSHSNPRGDLATVIEAALDLLIADRMKHKFGQTKRKSKPRPAKRTHVTNATRREVVARDGLQCSYVDASGQRCSSRAFLELDHRDAKAKGGSSEPEKVRILCRAHNQGEAERVFGKAYIERKKAAAKSKRNLTVRDSGRAGFAYSFASRDPRSAMSRMDANRRAPGEGRRIQPPRAPRAPSTHPCSRSPRTLRARNLGCRVRAHRTGGARIDALCARGCAGTELLGITRRTIVPF
jgi:hypothetical protein